MNIFIHNIGLLGPGMSNWLDGQAVLCREEKAENSFKHEVVIPQSKILPARERRRTGLVTHLALEVASQATATIGDLKSLYSLFASASADLNIFDYLCQALAMPNPMLSPTKFHNSLHNATAGYWSIATQSMQASCSVSAFYQSFAAGLLEAATISQCENREVLFVCYDMPAPQPLAEKVDIHGIFAVAMLLSQQPTPKQLAKIQLTLTPQQDSTSCDAADLEALRHSNPTARCLPLLQAIARRQQKTILLKYLQPHSLQIGVTP